MIIIILFLGQLLLHYFSAQVMSGSEVINYVSFAGTIVSIILAVLAIVYSFYQSFTQQNNVDLISREVEKLKKTSKDINKSSENISAASDVLPKILLEIETLPGLIDSTVASQIKMQTGVLLNDHAIDLKSFMTDSMSKSLSSLVNESSKGLPAEEEDSKPHSLFDGSELIVITGALAAYRILIDTDLNIIYDAFEKYVGDESYDVVNAIVSGSTAIIVAFIMTGDLSQNHSIGLRVRKYGNDNNRIARFVNYSFSELKDIKAESDSVFYKLRNEIFDLPDDESEILRMLNERIIGQ